MQEFVRVEPLRGFASCAEFVVAPYDSLKAQGARFPPSDGAPPVFTPPSNALSGAKGGGGGGGGGEPRVTSTQTMEKLEADLRVSRLQPRVAVRVRGAA